MMEGSPSTLYDLRTGYNCWTGGGDDAWGGSDGGGGGTAVGGIEEFNPELDVPDFVKSSSVFDSVV
jgi:hypothetical protein